MQNENLKFKIFTVVLTVSVSAFLFFNWKPLINSSSQEPNAEENNFEDIVLPSKGVILPVKWGDIGSKLVESGIIDSQKFEELYASRGDLTEEEKQILYGQNNGNVKITMKNAGFWLNMFWALGLGNKNEILEAGPMMKYDGDAGIFASTGGWTLARGDPSTGLRASAMNHYSRHNFLTLTPDEQVLVERVSKNIYRPCCNNPTYFPDCNHGMAMLGLLELMAAQGVSESDMYIFALQVNSYWFPDTYLTLAKYFQTKGISWRQVNPQEVLGRDYSSATGYRRILQQVAPVNNQGQSCGV